MTEILWDRKKTRQGTKKIDEDITIAEHKLKDINRHEFGITFRNGCVDQITKTDRVVFGVSRDGKRLYISEAQDDIGHHLSKPQKHNPIRTRYVSCTLSNTDAGRKVRDWMRAHQGNYYLNFDGDGYAYVTPFEEIMPKKILWANRA